MSFIELEGEYGSRDVLNKAVLVPAGVSAWAKEVGSLIVVDFMDFFATRGKKYNHSRSDQARGAGYEELHAYNLWVRQVVVGKGIFGPNTLSLGKPC